MPGETCRAVGGAAARGRSQTLARGPTTDAAEACVFGAWACAELGWRDDAIVERFSNGDLRVVAKRPLVD